MQNESFNWLLVDAAVRSIAEALLEALPVQWRWMEKGNLKANLSRSLSPPELAMAAMVIHTRATEAMRAAPKLTLASKAAPFFTPASSGASRSSQDLPLMIALKLDGNTYSTSPVDDTCMKYRHTLSKPCLPWDHLSKRYARIAPRWLATHE